MKNFYEVIYKNNKENEKNRKENNPIDDSLTKIKDMNVESYLQAIYNKADEYYDNRLADKDSTDEYYGGFYRGLLGAVDQKLKEADRDRWIALKKILEDADKNGMEEAEKTRLKNEEKEKQRAEKNREEKLALLVKGNICLRMGQYQSGGFKDAEESYRRAAKYLELGYKRRSGEKGALDQTDLLIALNLGKYFRNAGKSGHKTYFEKAVKMFAEIKGEIERKWKEGKKNPWEVHLWFDVIVNLGRVHEKLYYDESDADKRDNIAEPDIQDLPKDPLIYYSTIAALASPFMVEKDADIYNKEIKRKAGFSENDKSRIWNKDIKPLVLNDIKDIPLRDYFIQALVRTCITLRKRREYELVIELCESVLKIDKNNIDINNNKAVCYRKCGQNAEALELIKNYKTGNRFAEINYWKCMIKDKGKEGQKIEGEIKKIISKNKNDLEVKMLLALRMREMNEWDSALRIYREIYESAPYIGRGTIGLKAYYNVARCLLHQKKFYQAEKILEHILSICKHDVLAKIDLGWCRMGQGNFDTEPGDGNKEGACQIYEELLESVREKKLEKLGPREKMKIYNNYGECQLKINEVEKAKGIIKEGLQIEANNSRAFYLMASCHLAKANNLKFLSGKEESDYPECAAGDLEKAVDYLEKAVLNGVDEPFVESDIISARIRLVKTYRWIGDKAKAHIDYIRRQLTCFPETRYSAKTCVELVAFVEELNDMKENLINDLYKGISRLKFTDEEEGVTAFCHFQNKKEFMELDAVERGKILAVLFKLFKNVMEIKEQCRITSVVNSDSNVNCCDNGNIISAFPAHYTKLSTLKILLGGRNCMENKKDSDSPKLRLWNTTYMNDPYEGEIFIEMLKKTWSDPQSGGDENADLDILARYFPHIRKNMSDSFFEKEDQGEKAVLAPVNGNVYITSFSEENDGIQMWVNYTEKAKGCSIVFSEDFFDIHSKMREWENKSTYSDQDYPFYRVQYITTAAKDMFDNQNKENDCRINLKATEKYMQEICRYLRDMEKLLMQLKRKSDKASREIIVREFVVDMLNEIRFLFKDPEYKHEKELRMIRCSYDPEIDENTFEIPRLYIDVEKEISIEEIRLGPKYSDAEVNEIVSWIHAKGEGRVKKVTRSERHYR